MWFPTCYPFLVHLVLRPPPPVPLKANSELELHPFSASDFALSILSSSSSCSLPAGRAAQLPRAIPPLAGTSLLSWQRAEPPRPSTRKEEGFRGGARDGRRHEEVGAKIRNLKQGAQTIRRENDARGHRKRACWQGMKYNGGSDQLRTQGPGLGNLRCEGRRVGPQPAPPRVVGAVDCARERLQCSHNVRVVDPQHFEGREALGGLGARKEFLPGLRKGYVDLREGGRDGRKILGAAKGGVRPSGEFPTRRYAGAVGQKSPEWQVQETHRD